MLYVLLLCALVQFHSVKSQNTWPNVWYILSSLIKQWWPIMNKLVAGHSKTMLKPLKGLIDRGLSILRMNVRKYDN